MRAMITVIISSGEVWRVERRMERERKGRKEGAKPRYKPRIMSLRERGTGLATSDSQPRHTATKEQPRSTDLPLFYPRQCGDN